MTSASITHRLAGLASSADGLLQRGSRLVGWIRVAPGGWWRATGGPVEGAWDSRHLAGRMASLLMVVSGVASLLSLARPNAPGESPGGVLTVGLAAALFGVIVWFLPWRRWPSRLTLLLIPAGFLFIALRNYEGGNDRT